MAILLLRHASAGSRKKWKGEDRLRPLDRVGSGQAAALVDQLAGYPVSRIVTSPYVRCLQTVAPLADRLGLAVEARDELAEGASWAGVQALLGELDGATAVVCSHGDVILDLVGWEREARKGSTWILERGGDGFVPAVYLPPPA
jgi:8-oxo-dGTP diphosphatase